MKLPGALSVCHAAPVTADVKQDGAHRTVTPKCDKCKKPCEVFSGSKKDLAEHQKSLRGQDD